METYITTLVPPWPIGVSSCFRTPPTANLHFPFVIHVHTNLVMHIPNIQKILIPTYPLLVLNWLWLCPQLMLHSNNSSQYNMHTKVRDSLQINNDVTADKSSPIHVIYSRQRHNRARHAAVTQTSRSRHVAISRHCRSLYINLERTPLDWRPSDDFDGLSGKLCAEGPLFCDGSALV